MKINIIERNLTWIIGSILLMMLIFISIDVTDFYSDKETYAKVYALNTNQENWEWDYLRRWTYHSILIGIGLVIFTLRLIMKDNGTIRKINWAFLGLFLVSAIINLYNWMRSGIDH